MGNLCPTTGRVDAKERMRDLMHARSRQLEFEIRLQQNLKQSLDQRAADIATNAQRQRRPPTDAELLEVRRLVYGSKVSERNIAAYEKRLFACKALESTYLQAADNIDEHELNQQIVNEAKKLNIRLDDYEQTIEQTRALHDDLETMNDHLSDARTEANDSIQVDAKELDAQVSALFKAAPDSKEWQYRGVAIPASTASHTLGGNHYSHGNGYADDIKSDAHLVTNQEFGSRHQSVFRERLGLGPNRPRSTPDTQPLLPTRNSYIHKLTHAPSVHGDSEDEDYEDNDEALRNQRLLLFSD